MVLNKKTAIGEIVAANAIPVMLAPKPQKNDDNIKVQIRQNSAHISAVHDNTMELLDKTYLPGLLAWSPEEQQEAKSLITEYACIFTMHDTDLGKTSLGNYSINLTDYTPFNHI